MILLIAAALAADSAQHHVEQARLFVRKGWNEDARVELEAALATPEGATDPEVWWMLAQVRFELRDVEGARDAAEKAAVYARDPDAAAAASTFADWLGSAFGTVVIQAPEAGVQSRLQLEPASPQLDPELAGFVNEVAKDWTAAQPLPLRASLPAGMYTVNGQALTVEPGSVTTLDLPWSALGSGALAALQVTRLELASGVGVPLGQNAAHMSPSAQLQVGLLQPVGAWSVGPLVVWAPRSYVPAGAGPVTTAAASAGLRLSREIPLEGQLTLRPGLGYRVGWMPGIPLDCGNTSDGGLSCGAIPGLPVAKVYATGVAHTPFGELSLDWRKAGRTTATGLGVRLQVEPVIVQVKDGSAPLLGTNTTLDYKASGTWTFAELHALVSFSHAF